MPDTVNACPLGELKGAGWAPVGPDTKRAEQEGGWRRGVPSAFWLYRGVPRAADRRWRVVFMPHSGRGEE